MRKVVVLTSSYPRHDGDFAGRFVADAVAQLRARGLEVEVVHPELRPDGGGLARTLRRRPWLALTLFVSLVVAVAAAMWAASPGRRWPRVLLPALAILTLWRDFSPCNSFPADVNFIIRRNRYCNNRPTVCLMTKRKSAGRLDRARCLEQLNDATVFCQLTAFRQHQSSYVMIVLRVYIRTRG